MTRTALKQENGPAPSSVVCLDGVFIDKDDYPFTDASSDAMSGTFSDHDGEDLELLKETQYNDKEKAEFCNEAKLGGQSNASSSRNKESSTVETLSQPARSTQGSDPSTAHFRLSPTKRRRLGKTDELLTQVGGLRSSRSSTASSHPMSSLTSPLSVELPRRSSVAREDTNILHDLYEQRLDLFPDDAANLPSPIPMHRVPSERSSDPSHMPSMSVPLIRKNKYRSSSEEAHQLGEELFPEASRFTPTPPPAYAFLPFVDPQGNRRRQSSPQTGPGLSSPQLRPLPSSTTGLPKPSLLHSSLNVSSVEPASPVAGPSCPRHPPTAGIEASASSSRPRLSQEKNPPDPEPQYLSSHKCPVCLSPPMNATLTLCGHIACGQCLFTAVRTDMDRQRSSMTAHTVHPRCPVCRKQLKGWDGKGGGVIGLHPMVVIVVD